MTRSDNGQSDEQMDQILGSLLRVGVVISAAIVAIGGAIYLMWHGAELCEFHVFRGEPARLRHPAGIVRAALEGNDRGVIALGLLALIATPIVRVAFSIGAFARQRDYLYVVLTTIVLAILIYSVVGK
jgi:uncharacterized membrane protein